MERRRWHLFWTLSGVHHQACFLRRPVIGFFIVGGFLRLEFLEYGFAFGVYQGFEFFSSLGLPGF